MLIIADSAVIYMLPSVLELGLNSVMHNMVHAVQCIRFVSIQSQI